MNLGVTATVLTLNSTEWTASSRECRDSHGAKGQVLGELGLVPVRKQPEKLKISRKPRAKAKKTKENTLKRTSSTLPSAPEAVNEKKKSQQL